MKVTVEKFKEQITELNKRRDVHAKVLSRKLGKAIEENRLNCTWFNDGDNLAEIKTRDRTIELYVKGKFSGDLVNATTGEIEDSFTGAFQETNSPVKIHSDNELNKILDDTYEGYYIRYLDPVFIEASDGNITVGCNTLNCAEAILNVDFLVKEFDRIEKKRQDKRQELENLIFECKDFIRLAKGNFEKAATYMQEAEIRIGKIEEYSKK